MIDYILTSSIGTIILAVVDTVKRIVKRLMVKMVKQKVFSCEYCGKKYCSRSNLKSHVDTVHRGLKNECNICEKTFFDKWKLKTHMNTVHSSKRYECPYCIQTCSRIDTLRRHIKAKHEGPEIDKSDYPIVCELCGERYRSSTGLYDHIKSKHEGKTYSCPYCIKQLANRSSFHRHIKLDHDQWQYEKRLLEGKMTLDIMVNEQIPARVIPKEDMHNINLYKQYVHQKIETYKDINVTL